MNSQDNIANRGESEMRRPNILFIMTDQFRADAVGCVGGYTRTPHLDKLASRGTLFENAYTNSPECMPARFSLAVALYPHQTGVLTNAGVNLNPACPNWMQALETAGYRTSLFGKTHLHAGGDLRARVPLLQEYGLQVVDEIPGPRACVSSASNLTDLWQAAGAWDAYRADFADRFAGKFYVARPSPLPLELYYDSYVGRIAREYLERLDRSDQPWFCWVSFGGPHEPWDAPEPYASLHSPESMPKPRPPRDMSTLRGLLADVYASGASPPRMTAEDIAEMRANYAGSVALIDDMIGGILGAVFQRGEIDNTLVLFTSDHGEMNGDDRLVYKANFLDPSMKIPLIVVPPEPARTSMRSNALVELLDVGSTFLDYAGADRGRFPLSKSLRSLIEGVTTEHRGMVLSEYTKYACVITRDLKVEFDARIEPTMAFSRLNDPHERHDISRNETMRAHIADAAEALTSFKASTPPPDLPVFLSP